MRVYRFFAVIAVLSAIVLVPIVGWAQKEVVQLFEKGSINWSTGKVIAVGIGAPPAKPANMAQARAMARRAAVTVARRNLLEITEGVQVDSVTLAKDFIVQSDIIRTSVQGVVRNAQVIDTAYMSDGSVEVTMVMSMTGEFANVFLPHFLPVQRPHSDLELSRQAVGAVWPIMNRNAPQATQSSSQALDSLVGSGD